MARLTIEQVEAPDLTQASTILARAGESFNTGMESAKGLLGKYQEGIMAKNDQAILNDIAKLGSEEELNAYLNSDALVGKSFSPTMQETILGLRKGVLGFEIDRTNMRNATDSNNRANAAEGRTAADWQYGNEVRDEMNALTPLALAADEEARRTGFGSKGVDPNNPVFNGFISTVQQGGVNNPYALAAIAATGAHESGFSAKNAVSTWDDPSESGRPGTAGGVMSWNNDRLQRMMEFTGGDLSPEAQARYFLQEDPKLIEALNNAQSTDEAIRLMNSAWRFAGYDRPGGEASARAATAENLVPMFNGGQPITSNAPMGPAATALMEAMKNSTRLSPADAQALLKGVWQEQGEGQARIDEIEGRRTKEAVANATVSAVQDPTNLTENAVRGDLLDIPGVSASARLEAAGQDLAPLTGVITPSVREQPDVNAALERAALTDANGQSADPQVQAFALADKFSKSEDLGTTLIEQAGLTGDALEASGLDTKYVNAQIKSLANKAGVTEAQAAAALAQMDSEGFALDETLIMGRGGLSSEQVVKEIQNRFGPEASQRFEEVQAETTRRAAERESTKLQLDATRTAAAKLSDDDPRKAALTAQAESLAQTLIAGSTPQQVQQTLEDYVVKTGMASRLEGLDPNSAEFFRAMSQLEDAIRTDSTLTNAEKDLLIQAMRG